MSSYEPKDTVSVRENVPPMDVHKVNPSMSSSCISGRRWEEIEQVSWQAPHTVEQQKRMWYYSSLDMGAKHVVDEWGFSSASVSRSHSPNNAAKNQDSG